MFTVTTVSGRRVVWLVRLHGRPRLEVQLAQGGFRLLIRTYQVRMAPALDSGSREPLLRKALNHH